MCSIAHLGQSLIDIDNECDRERERDVLVRGPQSMYVLRAIISSQLTPHLPGHHWVSF